MAYFLKKTKLKNRTYLAIYSSFYSHEKKGSAHKCIKSLGSIESAIVNGINDPITHYKAVVDKMNMDEKEAGTLLISNVSPITYIGYFPLKNIMDKMHIKKYIDFFNITNDYRFDLYSLMSSLIFARAVNPCSKHRTFHEVILSLYEDYDFSYDQLLTSLSFMGKNYEKFIELFTSRLNHTFDIDTSKTYFDCTNFYFEIDREDDFRRKGPSKENRRNPLVGLGLLLDNNLISIGMKLYPGNESEKPILREVVDGLKRLNSITGKTVHIADKGLDCAQNIIYSLKNGDGYLFSKSVKGLSQDEKTWVNLDEGFRDVFSKDGKLLYWYKSCVDEFPYSYSENNKQIKVEIREKRVLTFNPKLARKKAHEITKLVEKASKLCLSRAKKSEYGECSNYVNFTNGEGDKAVLDMNQDAIAKDLKYAGYNLLVTSEIKMDDEEIYNTYHNLWRIEESFKIMKSDLDARPVYVQKESTIKGHFLICYIAVLLQRILQVKVLNNEESTSQINKFIKNFKVSKTDGKYINTITKSNFIDVLVRKLNLPLNHYYLSETQIKSILNKKI